MIREGQGLQWFSILILALSFTSCEVKRPDMVLSDAEMESLLYDYHIAKAMGEQVPFNENYKKVLYLESVYKKHGITEAQFDSSMVWFAQNPDILAKIYERVNEHLKTEKNNINHLIALRDNKPETSSPGDSIDIWAWQHVYSLSENPLNNKIVFSFPADSNFKDRDTLRWTAYFRFNKGRQDSMHALTMTMQIRYKNDSLIDCTKKIYRSGYHSITLSADTLGAINAVNGFIYYPDNKANNSVLIDRINLKRYHDRDTLRRAKNDTVTLKGKKEGGSDKDSIIKKQEAPVLKIDDSHNRHQLEHPRPVLNEPGIRKIERHGSRK